MAMVRYTVLALAVVVSAAFAWGQNLVSNPNFDTDVAGWLPVATADIMWYPLDADGNPASGSALVTNLSTTAGDSTGARQCIEDITGGEVHSVAAEILVPGGQSQTGRANLLIQWYELPNCSGFLGLSSTPWIYDSTPDVWYPSFNTTVAPSGAHSARLRLSVEKDQDSGTLLAHFDNVEFSKDQVFGDGFESSDTSAWSSVVGGV